MGFTLFLLVTGGCGCEATDTYVCDHIRFRVPIELE